VLAGCLIGSLARAGTPPSLLGAVTFRGQSYTTCEIDPARQDLRLYWDDSRGVPLRTFTALGKQIQAEGEKLLFAANAGMFEPSDKPVGLLVKNGTEQFPLNLADGAGNFYMKPNGVFVINAHHHALVIDATTYAALVPQAIWATQSGPLLVYGSNINPDFIDGSKNRKLRSGVGVTSAGRIVFALSKTPVTFYDFADLFLTKFKCHEALYLDGEISDFYEAGMTEPDGRHHFGPMFGLIEKAP
jgi:uncharacterized protein YigE (DUF2233 family)